MPDSKRFLHPETIGRIARLELRARHIVEGAMAGMHRSPYFGQSVEFLQHREYVPGDDLRHVDWQVWGRQDRLYIKQFEEDTNMRVNLLVDVSHSMSYGTGPLNKFDYGATIAASFAYLVLKQQDSIGCLTFDESVRSKLPTLSRRDHLNSIIESLHTTTPANKTELDKILLEAAETYPRRGMMILISDLFADPEATLKGLRLLRQRGHDVLVLHVLDQDEIEFPFTGPTRFDDMESETHLTCNPKALREGYLEALHTFLDTMRHGCARIGVDYGLIKTSDPLDAALTLFLTRRMGR